MKEKIENLIVEFDTLVKKEKELIERKEKLENNPLAEEERKMIDQELSNIFSKKLNYNILELEKIRKKIIFYINFDEVLLPHIQFFEIFSNIQDGKKKCFIDENGNQKWIIEKYSKQYEQLLQTKNKNNNDYLTARQYLQNCDIKQLKSENHNLTDEEMLEKIKIQMNDILNLTGKKIEKIIDGISYELPEEYFDYFKQLSSQKRKLEEKKKPAPVAQDGPSKEKEPKKSEKEPIKVAHTDNRKKDSWRKKIKKIAVSAALFIAASLSLPSNVNEKENVPVNIVKMQEATTNPIEDEENYYTQESIEKETEEEAIFDMNQNNMEEEMEVVLEDESKVIQQNSETMFQSLLDSYLPEEEKNSSQEIENKGQLGDQFTVIEGSPIYKTEYDVMNQSNPLSMYHPSTLVRKVIGEVFKLNNGTVKIAFNQSEQDAYQMQNAEKIGVLAENEKGIEGFYNLSDIQILQNQKEGNQK